MRKEEAEICPRCEKDIGPEEGTKLLTGEYVHEWCRDGVEHLEQMIGKRLDGDAPKEAQ
jgi:hypothetical protein